MLISDLLRPEKIQLEDILLDPNNPRFAALGEDINIIPENRYHEMNVQKVAYERMKNRIFEVQELRDTIKTLGFLPVDRIVVRKWKGVKGNITKYVVIEGNRRVAALKWLIELHASGKETFTPEQLNNFNSLDALILDDENAPETVKWILPGLRHVSGVKEWGPYQRARAVFILRELGCNPQEVALSLGLSTRAANQLWRSYLALEQMKNDEEYGEYAEPKIYSYFEETFKCPNVREWLAWDDNQRRFMNKERLREFFSWIVGEIIEEGEPSESKLPEAKSIRDLGKIIDDEKALSVFRGSGGSLSKALAKYEVEHPEDWRPTISSAELVLSALPPDTLRKFTPEDIERLVGLLNRLNQVFSDHKKLTS